jgi:hypothetical protein
MLRDGTVAMYISTLTGTFEIANADPRPPHPDEGLGLAMDTLRTMPIQGMRYPPQEGGSGWYIWGGEQTSQAADFFTAIKVRDIGDYIPNIHPFLDLPPGFRFQTDLRGKQKVWFDGSLLEF